MPVKEEHGGGKEDREGWVGTTSRKNHQDKNLPEQSRGSIRGGRGAPQAWRQSPEPHAEEVVVGSTSLAEGKHDLVCVLGRSLQQQQAKRI